MDRPEEIGQLSPEAYAFVTATAEKLEEAWSRISPEEADVEFETLLPTRDHPFFLATLYEVVKTDMSCRIQHGVFPRLEEYLQKYPELGDPSTVSPRLIFEEYLVQIQHGIRPALPAYKKRFPAQFAEVDKLIQAEGVNAPKTNPNLSKTPAPGGNMSRLEPGSIVGDHFKLLSLLGGGGFGEVWLGEDIRNDFKKAIKVIFRSYQSDEARSELDALKQIKDCNHPYLVHTESYFVEKERLLIVMELGEKSLLDSFKEFRAKGLMGIPPETLSKFISHAAVAIDYLHERSIVHRDIKPHNILIFSGIAKVADFGLAKLMSNQQSTRADSVVGTAQYMAPEAWNRKWKRSSDLYSLAITYAQMRHGRQVFKGELLPQLMVAHLSEPPDLRGLSDAEVRVLSKALDKDPNRRYTTCEEFSDALTQAARTLPKTVIPANAVPYVDPYLPTNKELPPDENANFESIAESAAAAPNAQTIITPLGDTNRHSNSDLGKKSKPPSTSSSKIGKSGSGNWREQVFKDGSRPPSQPEVPKAGDWREGIEKPTPSAVKSKPSASLGFFALAAIVLAILGGVGGLAWMQRNSLLGLVESRLKANDFDGAMHAVENADPVAAFFAEGAKSQIRTSLYARVKEAAQAKNWTDFLEASDAVAKHFTKDAELQSILKDASKGLLEQSLTSKSFDRLGKFLDRLPEAEREAFLSQAATNAETEVRDAWKASKYGNAVTKLEPYLVLSKNSPKIQKLDQNAKWASEAFDWGEKKKFAKAFDMVPAEVKDLKAHLEKEWRQYADSAFAKENFELAFEQWLEFYHRFREDPKAKERLESAAGQYFAQGLKSPDSIEKVLENFRQVAEKVPSIKNAVQANLASRWMAKEEAEFSSKEARESDRVAVLLRVEKFAPQFRNEPEVEKRFGAMKSKYFAEVMPRLEKNLSDADGYSDFERLQTSWSALKKLAKDDPERKQISEFGEKLGAQFGERILKDAQKNASQQRWSKVLETLEKFNALPELENAALKKDFSQRRQIIVLQAKLFQTPGAQDYRSARDVLQNIHQGKVKSQESLEFKKLAANLAVKNAEFRDAVRVELADLMKALPEDPWPEDLYKHYDIERIRTPLDTFKLQLAKGEKDSAASRYDSAAKTLIALLDMLKNEKDGSLQGVRTDASIRDRFSRFAVDVSRNEAMTRDNVVRIETWVNDQSPNLKAGMPQVWRQYLIGTYSYLPTDTADWQKRLADINRSELNHPVVQALRVETTLRLGQKLDSGTGRIQRGDLGTSMGSYIDYANALIFDANKSLNESALSPLLNVSKTEEWLKGDRLDKLGAMLRDVGTTLVSLPIPKDVAQADKTFLWLKRAEDMLAEKSPKWASNSRVAYALAANFSADFDANLATTKTDDVLREINGTTNGSEEVSILEIARAANRPDILKKLRLNPKAKNSAKNLDAPHLKEDLLKTLYTLGTEQAQKSANARSLKQRNGVFAELLARVLRRKPGLDSKRTLELFTEASEADPADAVRKLDLLCAQTTVNLEKARAARKLEDRHQEELKLYEGLDSITADAAADPETLAEKHLLKSVIALDLAFHVRDLDMLDKNRWVRYFQEAEEAGRKALELRPANWEQGLLALGNALEDLGYFCPTDEIQGLKQLNESYDLYSQAVKLPSTAALIRRGQCKIFLEDPYYDKSLPKRLADLQDAQNDLEKAERSGKLEEKVEATHLLASLNARRAGIFAEIGRNEKSDSEKHSEAVKEYRKAFLASFDAYQKVAEYEIKPSVAFRVGQALDETIDLIWRSSLISEFEEKLGQADKWITKSGAQLRPGKAASLLSRIRKAEVNPIKNLAERQSMLVKAIQTLPPNMNAMFLDHEGRSNARNHLDLVQFTVDHWLKFLDDPKADEAIKENAKLSFDDMQKLALRNFDLHEQLFRKGFKLSQNWKYTVAFTSLVEVIVKSKSDMADKKDQLLKLTSRALDLTQDVEKSMESHIQPFCWSLYFTLYKGLQKHTANVPELKSALQPLGRKLLDISWTEAEKPTAERQRGGLSGTYQELKKAKEEADKTSSRRPLEFPELRETTIFSATFPPNRNIVNFSHLPLGSVPNHAL